MRTEFNMRALEAVGARMDGNYQGGRAASSSIRVIRHGQECYRHLAGYADLEAGKPTAGDTIYRMYSMSKPVTMTALMQLYEKGLVYLEDPVSAFIPEFRDMPVAVTLPDGTIEYEKQKWPITVKNLCTMTSGLAYPGEGTPGGRIMAKLMNESNDDTPTDEIGNDVPTVEVVRIVAKKGVLNFQPGEKWEYGFSHDVVGALVEVISGKRYGDYLRENIFEPLQMRDAGFFVPEAKHGRFCNAYSFENGAYVRRTENGFNEHYFSDAAFQSGGGGLVATVDDYVRFCMMLLDGGTWRGERILGRKTIEMMRTQQLNDAQQATFGWADRGYGYGIGMRTMLRPWRLNGSVGEFGWDGMMGTWLAVDPAEDMVVVYAQNMLPYNDNGMRLMPIIYGAME